MPSTFVRFSPLAISQDLSSFPELNVSDVATKYDMEKLLDTFCESKAILL